MRILHINSYYSVSPFYKNLYELQVEAGDDISVYVPVARDYAGDAQRLGKFALMSKNHGKYDRAFFHLKHKKILRDVARKYDIAKFDVIHAHSLFSNGYIAYKLNARHGVPYVVAVRDTDVNTFFRLMPHLRGLGRKILAAASRVVFISNPYRDAALKPYLSDAGFAQVRRKSVVLPNGIDPMWLERMGTGRSLQGQSMNVIFAGQLIPRKNVGVVIGAVKLLRDEGYDARLRVAGRATDAREMKKVSDCPYAEYLGAVSMEQLMEIYRQNDMLIVPSKTETFGLVYAEALSQGLPVVYTRGQGFDGQFPDGEVGFGVPHHDARAVADAAVRIAADYAAMSKRAVEGARRFDWRDIERGYAAIYEEIRANA